jgi:Spy/CpxP family protein refolding chaperone
MKRNTWIGVAMVAVLLLCAVGAALAQGQKGNFDPAQMIERQVTAMKDRLKLNDDQAAKIKTILTDGMKANAELRKKYKVQPGEQPSDEAREAMMKARQEQTQKINEVLTDDQKAEYRKFMEERRGQGGPGGGRRKKQ